MTLGFKLSIIFLLTYLFQVPSALADPQSTGPNISTKKVIIFSTTYCPNCLYVKDYLSQKNIPFSEYDIEKSATAKRYFDKLGGRGTPFLLVNNYPMQGFNQNEFWQYYKK